MPEPKTDAAIPFPPHAYVPGQNARHDAQFFQALHASVTPGMTPDQLMQTRAWAVGQIYLDQGYFWEAHEVLETVWLQTKPNSVERHFVQAMIQLANAALKERMNRPKAVRALCDRVDTHLRACRHSTARIMNVSPDAIARRNQELRNRAT